MIKHMGDEWCVFNKEGTKKLGCHPTEKEAEAQLAAIEASKARAHEELTRIVGFELTPAQAEGIWAKVSGSAHPHAACVEMMGGKVDDADAFCAAVEIAATGHTPSERTAKSEQYNLKGLEGMADGEMRAELKKRYPDWTAEQIAEAMEKVKSGKYDADSGPYSLTGVEVFATGTHNGDKYTEADLDDMVAAFGHLDYKPPLKAGHSEDRKGMPALGWVQNLRRMGEKLVADFIDLPRLVYDAIRDKRYNTVSSEVYWNLERGGKKYRRALKAVALLGAEIPAVANLRPLHEMFDAHAEAVHEGASLVLKYGEGEVEMDRKELEELLKASVTAAIDPLTKQLADETAARKALEEQLKSAARKAGSDSIEGVIRNLDTSNHELDAEVLRKQKEAAERKASDAEERRKAAEAKAAEEAERTTRLALEQRKRQVKDLADRCRVPALRTFVADFADLATRAEDVKVYDDKGEMVSALAQVESFISYINDNAKKLFIAYSEAHGDDTPREADASKELDRRAREYMQKTGEKEYLKALRAVVESDPTLKQAYQAGSSAA